MSSFNPEALSWQAMESLVDAEDYFTFFDVPFDAQVVNVNRLHILQLFSQKLEEIDPSIPEPERLTQARQALEQSYQTFLDSSSLDQKLFKVFHQRPQGVVMLSEITSD